ncbi:hypothetical protein CERSUDRAFT_116814 [Gelatoporia subvermispora B]|uniref:Histone deacetylase interacting domain-containing protein n=1 Tax=Ceriporiopsis subvermispora (strain B) TaxID=914234 RepID=M2QR32_CERS8|nr:hypothetical protein CERSUDRAFT_116814 [Gelatoporia subvermispora B]
MADSEENALDQKPGQFLKNAEDGAPDVKHASEAIPRAPSPKVAAIDPALTESEGVPEDSALRPLRGPSPSEKPIATPSQFAQPQPISEVSSGASERPLNVTDALSYLDSVKMQFQDNPDVYNRFLDIMKDFKSQLIDTPGVIERVSNLFHGHPMLIQGFNTFLPAGYRIECTTDTKNPNFITVTTPMGTTTQATNSFAFGTSLAGTAFANIPRSQPLLSEADSSASVNVAPALSFVQKVKTRYANDPDRYKRFLEILYSSTALPSNDVRDMEHWSVAYLSAYYAQGDVVQNVRSLFHDAPELMREFTEFLPDPQTREAELAKLAEQEEAHKAAADAEAKASKKKAAASSSVPQKRKRKPAEKEDKKEKEKGEVASKVAPSKAKKPRQQAPVNEASSPPFSQRHVIAPSSPRRSSQTVHSTPQHVHHHPPQPLPAPVPVSVPQAQVAAPQPDESQFFEQVKRALDNRETYNEFLKLINLFTQDIIDMPRLVRESRTFLSDSELMEQFKRILGWDERRERERLMDAESVWTRPMAALDRPSRDQLNLRYGSYRKLPANEIGVTCSGRDEMCKSVLNDDWIAQPTFASEDAGFLAHKKNVYEEALHRSEEERHEYDFHIDAIHRTIQILEPLNSKIAQLSPEDRAAFKLKPNLGGAGKAIHQRVIKKIYGREAGMEVYQAIQDTPAAAIPVVLQRLKLKHEEWKRAQREWNKVWREVDARNFHKSLDHQGITFKAADKKAITAKTFVSQIEAARDEQRAKRAALVDPLFARTRPRHQLEFSMDNVAVLQDAIKLTLSFLDRTQGQINLADRRKIETFLRSFIPLFFVMDARAFNSAFVPHHEILDSDMDVDGVGDDSEIASVSTSARGKGKKGAGGSSGDLRKKLLKSEQAKSSRRTRAQEFPSPSVSRMASPAVSDTMRVDGEESRSEHAATNGEPAAGPSSSSTTDNIWQTTRKRYSFFTNTTFYVLFRLLELLYTRLHLFKGIAAKLASDPSAFKTPRAAVDVGLAARLGGTAHAVHFYDLMLESCEKLFDNELEQHIFEEQMRYMFGTKDAYKIFTVDKLVGAIVKQIQQVLSDQKSQELYDLLKRERDLPSPTTQDQINNRRNTEKVIGPDENLFRMDWLPESKTVTIQLLGKDDSSYDDSEVLTGRWQAYIDSFVSSETTEGVPARTKLRQSFLRRNRRASSSSSPPPILAQGGLEIKVCVRTYRLFYVSGSEDILWRVPRTNALELDALHKRIERAGKRRKAWVEKMQKARDGTDAATSTAAAVSPEKEVAPPSTSASATTPTAASANAKPDTTTVNGTSGAAPSKSPAEPTSA